MSFPALLWKLTPTRGQHFSEHLIIGAPRPTLKCMLQHHRMDLLLRSLADGTRRRIIERLAVGPASATELARPFEMSLSAVMQHLAILERSDMVRSEKIGRVRTFHLQTAPLREVEAWLHDQRTGWESRLDRLGDELAGENALTEGEDR